MSIFTNVTHGCYKKFTPTTPLFTPILIHILKKHGIFENS